MWAATEIVPVLALVAHASLFGAVRSNADGMPLAGVSVDIPLGGKSVLTDARGEYAIRDLDPGPYHVFVSHSGYRSRDMVVVIPAGDSLRIDVALEPLPRPLAPMHVVANTGEVHTRQAEASGFPELGRTTVRAAQMRSRGQWLGRPDALAALADAPGVSVDAERAGGFLCMAAKRMRMHCCSTTPPCWRRITSARRWAP